MASRGKWSAADEASFALLEPDGVSPLKARRYHKSSNSRALIVFAIMGIFILFFLRPKQPSTSMGVPAAAPPSIDNVVAVAEYRAQRVGESSSNGGGGGSIKSSSSSSDDEVVVVNPQRAVATSVANFQAANQARQADSREAAFTGRAAQSSEPDVIIVQPAKATAVATASSRGEAKTSFVSFKVDAASDGAGPAVVRHVAQGDDQDDPSPPPPPPPPFPRISAWKSQWMTFQKSRSNRRDPSKPDSAAVARMIYQLDKEVRERRVFEPGEMGLRLAEIESLEREEANGAQKRTDDAAKARLEETVRATDSARARTKARIAVRGRLIRCPRLAALLMLCLLASRCPHQVRAAATKMGDDLSIKIATVEQLMSEHGPRHPDVLPRLKQLEAMVMQSPYGLDTSINSSPSGKAALQRLKVRGLVKRAADARFTEDLGQKAAAIEWQVKNGRLAELSPPPPPRPRGSGRNDAEEEEKVWDSLAARESERPSYRSSALRRKATNFNRRGHMSGYASSRVRGGQESDDGDDGEDEEIVVIRRPVRSKAD